jgi:ssRNA-specific RNase YbeY (16S rRNA maturation enzyme)
LTFETGARFIGDIVISMETAQSQAAERGFSLQEELEMLFVHALLTPLRL